MENKGVRPKMPRLKSNLAKFVASSLKPPSQKILDKPEKQYMGKRFIGALMPDQYRETSALSMAKRESKNLLREQNKTAKLEARREQQQKKADLKREKKLMKEEIKMNIKSKQSELKQIQSDIKTLRSELSYINKKKI